MPVAKVYYASTTRIGNFFLENLISVLPTLTAGPLSTNEYRVQPESMKVLAIRTEFWGKYNPDIIIEIPAHAFQERLDSLDKICSVITQKCATYLQHVAAQREVAVPTVMVVTSLSEIQFGMIPVKEA